MSKFVKKDFQNKDSLLQKRKNNNQNEKAEGEVSLKQILTNNQFAVKNQNKVKPVPADEGQQFTQKSEESKVFKQPEGEKPLNPLKQQKKERKQQKNLIFSDINKQVVQLWSKKLDQRQKVTIANNILKRLQPIIFQVVHKRDGSKAVQACIKYGDEQIRNRILKLIVVDQIEDIIKSKYGQFVILRALQFMSKSDQSYREKIFSIFHKNVLSYAAHLQASRVMDKFARDIATPNQLSLLKQQIDVLMEGQQMESEEIIENLAVKLIEKSDHYPLISKHILQLALAILIPAEREKIIEFLRDKILDLVEDKEGIKLAISVINFAGAQDRKIIIKQFKDQVVPIVKAEKSLAFTILLKLIHSVDDTVLIERTILKEIKDNLEEIIHTKHGFSIISSIFIPTHNALHTVEKPDQITFTTSKKDPELRLNELQQRFIDDVLKIYEKLDENTIYQNGGFTRLTSALMKYILKSNKNIGNQSRKKQNNIIIFTIFQDNRLDQFEFVELHFDNMLNDAKEKLASKKFDEEALICHIDGHRVLKNIIQCSGEFTGKAQDFCDEKVEKVMNLLLKNLDIVIQSRAAFLALALLESTSHKDLVKKFIKKGPQIKLTFFLILQIVDNIKKIWKSTNLEKYMVENPTNKALPLIKSVIF